MTFRTSLGNRKDKEKEGAAIVPRKRCPGQARDLPSFCCNDGGRWRNPLIHTPSYELQPGTKVRLTNRASNRDHLEHAEMSGERQDHCSSFKTYNPSRHTPYAEPAYFFTFCRSQSSSQEEDREEKHCDSPKSQEEEDPLLCRVLLSGASLQTAVGLGAYTHQQRLTAVQLLSKDVRPCIKGYG